MQNIAGNRGCNSWREEWEYGDAVLITQGHVSAYLSEFLINEEPLTIPCYIDKG